MLRWIDLSDSGSLLKLSEPLKELLVSLSKIRVDGSPIRLTGPLSRFLPSSRYSKLFGSSVSETEPVNALVFRRKASIESGRLLRSMLPLR